MCMLVRVYQQVHKSSNSQTINFHQAYIIILTQRLNNCTIRLKVIGQWPLVAMRNNLVAGEQQSRCSDIQTRCSGKHSPLKFSNPSQSNTARTILAVTGAFYLNSQTRHSNCMILFIIWPRLLQWDSFSLQRVLSISNARKINSLVIASSNLAARSSNDFQ